MILLWIISPLCFVFVHCSHVVTCLEMAYLLDFLYMLFYCAFVTFPCGVLGQVWCLIVSVPDLCLLSYFHIYIHLFQQTLQMFFSVTELLRSLEGVLIRFTLATLKMTGVILNNIFWYSQKILTQLFNAFKGKQYSCSF